MGRELHADRRLRFVLKLVLRVPEQQLGLTDTRVSDQHNFEHKLVLRVDLRLAEELLLLDAGLSHFDFKEFL